MNMRTHHISFPPHSASNFCTFSGTDALKVMVPVNNSVGWVPRRSMDTKELHLMKDMDLPFISSYQICATLPSFLITTFQTFVHSHEESPKT